MFPIINNGKLVDLPLKIASIYKHLECNIENECLQIKSSVDCNIYNHFITIDDTIILNLIVMTNKEDKLSPDTKITEIIIGNATEYKIMVFLKGNTAINKKAKKESLNLIEHVSDKVSIYSINSNGNTNNNTISNDNTISGLYLIDSTGFMKYYPDNENIFEYNPENIDITQHKLINTELPNTAYDLKPLPKLNSTITPIPESIILKQQQEQQVSVSNGGIIGSIGYIASWFNPFSYMGSGNTSPNTSANTSPNTSANTTTPEPQINKPQYYIDKSNNNIIKVCNKEYKVIVPVNMYFPTCINNIEINIKNGNIISMSGKLDKNEKYNIQISFNKDNKINNITIQ